MQRFGFAPAGREHADTRRRLRVGRHPPCRTLTQRPRILHASRHHPGRPRAQACVEMQQSDRLANRTRQPEVALAGAHAARIQDPHRPSQVRCKMGHRQRTTLAVRESGIAATMGGQAKLVGQVRFELQTTVTQARRSARDLLGQCPEVNGKAGVLLQPLVEDKRELVSQLPAIDRRQPSLRSQVP
ncbi:MAG: hypothetical protein EBT54_03715, partial [Betaproteobacteria bacterium]|nr:hypothetical protein [Betaproteobacteria bacterium]